MMFKALPEVFLGRPVLGFSNDVSSSLSSQNHIIYFLTGLNHVLQFTDFVSWPAFFRPVTLAITSLVRCHDDTATSAEYAVRITAFRIFSPPTSYDQFYSKSW